MILEEKIDMIGLQETIKIDFSHKDLDEVGGELHFAWAWKEAKGHSGGILI
jgi:hypothetical protein